MSCALWGKPSFLISCPWKTTYWILHASFLSGRSPQFACYYILSEESTLEFSNVMCLVGKALWVSCVMTFVLKENPLSFSCYVLCAEGKPSDSESEFLMSCPLCWRKALWVWVSHVMSFVLKESRLSLSFSCHVLCAEGKPSDSEFLMSCPLCWRKALRVWVSHVMSFVLKENPGTWESEYWNWMTSWERTLLKSWQRQELFKRSIDCWTWLD